MKIAIDVSSAAKSNPTGIARYQVELIRAAGPQLSAADSLLLTMRLKRWIHHRQFESLFAVPGVGHPRWRIPAVDLFHAAGVASPRRTSALKAVTIFDTVTIDATRFSSPRFAERYSRNLRRAVSDCDLILTISNFVRDRILSLFPALTPSRVIVTFPGADHVGFSTELQPHDCAALERFGLSSRPFILSVGRIERRKNPEGLVKAFGRAAAARDHLLVFAGARGDSDVDEAVAAAGVADRVRFLGRVDDGELGSLYRGARAFAMPSHYEGFGIPLLEAMSCGTPSLGSNCTAVPEVAGEAALLVDPTRIDALADALERLLLDRALRRELRARGPVQAAKFNWRRCARETLDAYRFALELGPRR